MNILKKLFGQKDTEIHTIKVGDPRLPLKTISGLYNVRPWNCETTQVHTANWPHNVGCFFLELKGSWKGIPPMDVIVLDACSGILRSDGRDFLSLTSERIESAIEFIREHWPKDGAEPSCKLVEVIEK